MSKSVMHSREGGAMSICVENDGGEAFGREDFIKIYAQFLIFLSDTSLRYPEWPPQIENNNLVLSSNQDTLAE